MKINVEAFERELTDYMAGRLGRVVDKTIFRGGLPTGVSCGAAVLIDSDITPRALIDVPTYNVQVIGKFDSRAAALSFIGEVGELLPVYGVALPSFIIVSMSARGDGGTPFDDQEQGHIRWYASYNLIVSVKV